MAASCGKALTWSTNNGTLDTDHKESENTILLSPGLRVMSFISHSSSCK